MTTRPLVTAIAVATLLFGAPALAQDVEYQWTDAEGVVHQGQHPPEGVNAKPVRAEVPLPEPKKTPLANAEIAELIERCDAAREAEIRACLNDHADDPTQCDGDNANFAKKLAQLPDCVELAAESERRKGER